MSATPRAVPPTPLGVHPASDPAGSAWHTRRRLIGETEERLNVAQNRPGIAELEEPPIKPPAGLTEINFAPIAEPIAVLVGCQRNLRFGGFAVRRQWWASTRSLGRPEGSRLPCRSLSFGLSCQRSNGPAQSWKASGFTLGLRSRRGRAVRRSRRSVTSLRWRPPWYSPPPERPACSWSTALVVPLRKVSAGGVPQAEGRRHSPRLRVQRLLRARTRTSPRR